MVQQLINGNALVGIALGSGNGAEGWAVADDGIVQGVLHALAVGHEDGIVGVGGIGPGVVLGLQPAPVLGIPLDALFRPVSPVQEVIVVVLNDTGDSILLVDLKRPFILQRRWRLCGGLFAGKFVRVVGH